MTLGATSTHDLVHHDTLGNLTGCGSINVDVNGLVSSRKQRSASIYSSALLTKSWYSEFLSVLVL